MWLNLLQCLVIRLLIKFNSGNCFIVCMLKLQTSSRPKCPITKTILGSSITSNKKLQQYAIRNCFGPQRNQNSPSNNWPEVLKPDLL